MFLAPDGDEIEIATAAAEFLADSMPIDRLHRSGVVADMDAATRKRLGDMGWFALALDEDQGGSGLSAVEHALFFREVGRQCGPVDVLAQTLAAMTAKDAAMRSALLGGDTGAAIAIPDGDRWRLLGGLDATCAVIVTRDDARLISLDDIVATGRPALDPVVSMRMLDVAPAACSAVSGGIAWNLGQLGIAAMLIGIAEAALDQIVDYAKVRETFGRKIGAYQAVRHTCADMALRAETARCQLWFAAAAVKEGRADAGVHLDAAKHLANRAAIGNADSNIQLHGGIGVTEEHHAHLYLKHAMLLGKLFGSTRALLDRLLVAETDD